MHFDPTQEIILSCDASAYAIGAVLAHQLADGSEKSIGFASWTLSNAENKYFQVEKEVLACVFGSKRFHAYLYSVNTEIFVDTIFQGLNFCGDTFSWVRIAHENLTATKNLTPCIFIHETKWRVKTMSSTRRSSVCLNGMLEDSGPLGSGRPLMGHKYFRNAIDDVQARGHYATVITMWLISRWCNFLWI